MVCGIKLTNEELKEYEEITFLCKKQIIRAWEAWLYYVTDDSYDKLKRYPVSLVQRIPILKRDSSMSFEDFLDLLSATSSDASFSIKAHYAFLIYDTNEDGFIDSQDFTVISNLLFGSAFNHQESIHLIQKLMEESDLDGGGVSEEEFKHLLSKCPDFVYIFRLYIC